MSEQQWKAVRLRDVVTVRSGFAFKSDDWLPDGVPVVKIANVKDGRLEMGGCSFVSESIAREAAEFELVPGDILIAMTGYIGEVAKVRHEGRCLLNQRVGRFAIRDESLLDRDFLFLWLRCNDNKDTIANLGYGSAQPNISPTLIGSIELDLPPLPEQRSIARVLGGLDDKIELNRRMNRTLEDLARGLFRSWFVDFDPVLRRAGAAGTARGLTPHTPPHAPWPARLVDSPLGPIPEGWRVGTVGEIGTNPRRGVLPSEVDSTTPYIGLEHMPRRCIALDDWGTAADVSSGKSRFTRGEILFGKLRPYFHKVGVALIDGVCSTDVIVAAPKKECWFGVLLGHLSSDEFIDYVDGASGGTRMPRTSWGDMARYQIAIPPEPIAASFAAWMRQVFELMRVHAHESRSLAALRDALLPQLLSGEIRLRDAERAASDSLQPAGTPRRGDGITLPRTGKAAGSTKGRA